MKETYIAIMDRVLDAYSHEHILSYFDSVKQDGIKEHGFPRLTADIGILIAHGRRLVYKDLFIQMMDFCCESFLLPAKKGQGNDFSVKEIIFCLLEVEKANCVPKEKTEYWRSLLAKISYADCYNIFATSREEEPANWALFSAVSEHMRQAIGLADTRDFVDTQVATQLKRLDENSMYRDHGEFRGPHNPIVYDLVPRGLFCVLMHFGYNGEFRQQIDDCLQKAGLLTLQMQSVTGEIPFGGRSSQFFHNEAQMALILEYEANRYAALGNMELAGQCKTGVRKALQNIQHWLSREKLTHIKNNYPLDTKHGCEGYAYFDKYMVTTASFLYVAYLFCDDAIPEVPIPTAPAVFSLSDHFHKTFLRNENWFAELDTNGDPHYDASGIGRIHKAGFPSALCLSVPGSAAPNYTIEPQKAENFSITVGIPENDTLRFATGNEVKYTKTAETVTETTASVTMDCDFGSQIAKLNCQLNPEDVTISAEAVGDVALLLPVFAFDGQNATEITCWDTAVEVAYQGCVCRYTANAPIFDLGKTGSNRNGEYRLFCARGRDKICVKVEMQRV